jgi:shikimate kinase
MNGCAPTVYLKATPEVLQAHLKMGKTVRPLIAGKTPEQLDAFIRESLETREPFYGRASHTVHVDEVIHTPRTSSAMWMPSGRLWDAANKCRINE